MIVVPDMTRIIISHSQRLNSPEELSTSLENFSNSYSDSGGLDALTKRISKSIDVVHVLADVKFNENQRILATKHRWTTSRSESADKQIIAPIVASNIDLSHCIKSCRDLRRTIQTTHDKAQELADENFAKQKFTTIRASIKCPSIYVRAVYNLQVKRYVPDPVLLKFKKMPYKPAKSKLSLGYTIFTKPNSNRKTKPLPLSAKSKKI